MTLGRHRARRAAQRRRSRALTEFVDGGLDDGLVAAPPSTEELNRDSAKLRERFQVIKDKLLELSRNDGDVGGPRK